MKAEASLKRALPVIRVAAASGVWATRCGTASEAQTSTRRPRTQLFGISIPDCLPPEFVASGFRLPPEFVASAFRLPLQFVASASYEAGQCQTPCVLHTPAEAAEQALPEQGPRWRPGSDPAALGFLRAGGFTRVAAALPRTSYPDPCAARIARDCVLEARTRRALL